MRKLFNTGHPVGDFLSNWGHEATQKQEHARRMLCSVMFRGKRHLEPKWVSEARKWGNVLEEINRMYWELPHNKEMIRTLAGATQ